MRRLSPTQQRRLLHVLRWSPVRLRRLYMRKVFHTKRRLPPEVRGHRSCLKGPTGDRFYGLAYWRQGGGDDSIILDVGCMGSRHYQACSWWQMIGVLVHEACHITFDTHYVTDLTKRAMKSRQVRNLAARRLILALIARAKL